jgi:hypothetical protein
MLLQLSNPSPVPAAFPGAHGLADWGRNRDHFPEADAVSATAITDAIVALCSVPSRRSARSARARGARPAGLDLSRWESTAISLLDLALRASSKPPPQLNRSSQSYSRTAPVRTLARWPRDTSP